MGRNPKFLWTLRLLGGLWHFFFLVLGTECTLDNPPSILETTSFYSKEQLLVTDWRICLKPFGAILCLLNVVTKCFATWDASPWVHMSKTIKIIGRLLRGRRWDYSKGSKPYSGLCEESTHMWGLHTHVRIAYTCEDCIHRPWCSHIHIHISENKSKSFKRNSSLFTYISILLTLPSFCILIAFN